MIKIQEFLLLYLTLTGKSKYQSTTELRNSNLNISVEGTGTVVVTRSAKGFKR